MDSQSDFVVLSEKVENNNNSLAELQQYLWKGTNCLQIQITQIATELGGLRSDLQEIKGDRATDKNYAHNWQTIIVSGILSIIVAILSVQLANPVAKPESEPNNPTTMAKEKPST